jgi:hypothetical protein
MAQVRAPRSPWVVGDGGLWETQAVRRATAAAATRWNPWPRRYLWLLVITSVAAICVAPCALQSELEAVRWRLEQAVGQQQALAVSRIHACTAAARQANLREVISKLHMTPQEAGVLKVEAPAPLPPEQATPLTLPASLLATPAQSSSPESLHAGVTRATTSSGANR